jgi:hypothetical protein
VPLSADRAVEQAEILKGYHQGEREALDTIRRYWKGRQGLPAVIPSAAPREVRTMAEIARVNVCSIVIDTLAQSMFVDGFRGKGEEDDAAVWDVWQANKMDARQTGLHRAAFAYRASYAIVLPGDPLPVIRPQSPRNLTAVYGEDPDWPMWALERLGAGAWRLFDDEAVYYLSEEKRSGQKSAAFSFNESREHGLGVTPVVRFLDEEDLDADDDVEPESTGRGRRRAGMDVPMGGQIVPLMSMQDQIDLHTFGLLVAEWYGAFRQRYAIGWVAPSEKKLLEEMVDSEDPTEAAAQAEAARRAAQMRSAASQLWTFDENPEDLKLGEFEQTNLDGYIKSREASMKHAATLSQTPVHELIGELVNLSAEALVAAEKGRDRKVEERKALLGESHEQMLRLAGRAGGFDVPEDAQVVWRDTSARAFAATVDALGKLVQMLGVPPQELWERVPGVTRADIQRWKQAAEEGDAFAFLGDMLERQASNGDAPTVPVAP